MFKRYASGMIAAAAALSALSGCAGGEPAGEARNQPAASAADLVTAASRGLDMDYDPLASPADAISASELIVRGTVADVTAGITFGGPGAAQAGRSPIPFATVVIDVDTTLDGAAIMGSKVYAQLNTSSAAQPPELARAGTGLRVVAVLDDISAWSPAPGATVVRPAGVPADGPLYFAFPDGLWLQGGADTAMAGVHADPAELPTAWDAPQTLDEYWATLQAAEE